MPPRWLTAAIVTFWLAMTTWLFWHDVRPRLRARGAPPYTVNLADEARDSGRVDWDVFWNGQTVGHAATAVIYRSKEKEFLLRTIVKFDNFRYSFEPLVRIAIMLERMNTEKTVAPDGQLKELQGEVAGSILDPLGGAHDGRVEWSGMVLNGAFEPHWRLRGAGIEHQDFTTEKVRVPNEYSMLSTLEPWNRLLNLQPDQEWRVTRFDPALASLAALAGISPSPDTLDAGVLHDTEELQWDGRPVECLVIEYRGQDGERDRTWVRKDDGRVLRQEYRKPGDKTDEVFAMERTPPFALERRRK